MMGVFDNAKNVVINNKNVKSIISTEDNMTLFLNSYLIGDALTLFADKSIIQSGQTVDLEAVLRDGADNVSIDFVQKDKQLFKDIATTGRKNSNWTVGSNLTETVGSEYTTISSTNSNSATGRYLTTTEFTGDFEVQFQSNITYANTWAFYFGFRDTADTTWRINVSDWRYIKCGRLNGTYYAKISSDGETWEDMTAYSELASTGAVKFQFYIYNATNTEKSIQYKDLLVTTDYVWDTINTVNGVASYTYTGVGEGCLTFKAKYQQLESSEINVIDAIIYDDFERDTGNGILNMNYMSNSIELSTEWHKTGSKSAKCVLPSSTEYVGWGVNSPSSVMGSTIHYQLDYKATGTGKFRAMVQRNGTWADYVSDNISVGEGHLENTLTLPSDATGVRLRFSTFTNGGTVYIDNWAIYQD